MLMQQLAWYMHQIFMKVSTQQENNSLLLSACFLVERIVTMMTKASSA